ncbi:MAG: Ig-like domain-containing protein, partial [Anaerolineae bacterium]
TLGRQGKTTAGGYWNGALDDVRVYARALSVEELEDLVDNQSWGNLSPPTGVVRSNFDASLNHLKTEGNYRVDLRSGDAFGNQSDTTQGWPLWSGSLDSISPRLSFQYRLTVVGSSNQVHYQFSAHDFGLVEAGFVSPCPASTTLTREYFNAPWYRAWTYQTAANSDRLYQLSGQCDLPFTGQVVKMQVCDAAGNCTKASPELLPKVSLATAAPSAAPSPSGEGGVLILEPSPSTFLTTTLPLQIQGGAFSPGFVKSLTIRDGNRVIDNLHWAHLAITDTTWTTTWTPDGEGPHQIEATLRDWAGGAYTDTVTVILDTQPPEVAITTAVLTSTHVAGGQVTVAGTANDANGITAVDLQARGVWRPARIEDGTWTATWIPDLGKPPDGQIFTGVARAVDRAGWSTLASGDVYVDAASPAPVDLALSYQTAGETIPITRTGTTIREAVGALEMAWTASSDGSGLADYRAGWTAVGADGSATTSWITLTPEEPRLATATAGEAQKLVASL